MRATAIGTLITAFVGVISVMLVAWGLHDTNEANRKQQDLARLGQATERFSAAIDKLGQEGEEKRSIRLGGIFDESTRLPDGVERPPAQPIR